MSSEKSTDGDLVEQFKRDHPKPEYLRNVSKRHNGAVDVEFKDNYTLGVGPQIALLESGWFVSSKFSGDKFTFRRFELEEREVEKTIIETETVATVADR